MSNLSTKAPTAGSGVTQRYRSWAPLPMRFGDDVGALPELGDPDLDPECPPAEEISGRSVAYVRRPAQLLAVRWLRGKEVNK